MGCEVASNVRFYYHYCRTNKKSLFSAIVCYLDYSQKANSIQRCIFQVLIRVNRILFLVINYFKKLQHLHGDSEKAFDYAVSKMHTSRFLNNLAVLQTLKSHIGSHCSLPVLACIRFNATLYCNPPKIISCGTSNLWKFGDYL